MESKLASQAKKVVERWWTQSPSDSWNQARLGILERWGRLVGAEKRLQETVAEAAIRFGHAGRRTYLQMKSWTSDTEDQLMSDWKEAGYEAENAWSDVRGAVRHGWDSGDDDAEKSA